MESTQIVIIGGGATGILWDLSLRGMPAILLEQGDIAHGATGRCHGLLHSGSRYVVEDPNTALGCLKGNRTIRSVAPDCVEDVGGFHVQCPEDDPAYFEEWHHAVERLGIATKRLAPEGARSLEPCLAGDILGAFTSPDAYVDVFRLVLSLLRAADSRGDRFQPYSKIISIRAADQGFVESRIATCGPAQRTKYLVNLSSTPRAPGRHVGRLAVYLVLCNAHEIGLGAWGT